MEISGTVLRHVSYVSGAGTHMRSRGVVVPRLCVRMETGSGFCDEAHLQYYNQKVPSTKKKLKLLKGFSKLGLSQDPQKLAMFYDLQQHLTSDAGEVLLRQLEEARAKEKAMKKQRKQEKKEKKAKLKASKVNCESSSSSSSESSDSDCDLDQVVDMNSFRAGVGVGVVAPAPVDESPLPKTTIVEDVHRDAMELCSKNDISVSRVSSGLKNECAVVTNAPQKRIEVCMGNKCKKSGAATLLQEFEKVVGVEGGAVVGCKCMGKCKTAPNVRVQSSVDHSLAQGLHDSVQVPVNPLCIGVGLEDVDAIVARFLGENHPDVGLASAAT